MSEYHKIETVYKRDPDTKYKTLLEGDFARPEFNFLADNEWQFTEKVDGTNVRVYWDGELSFRGRTDKADIPPFLEEALNNTFAAQYMAEVFDGPAVLYGEGFGPKIQKGGKYRQDHSFILFDVVVGDYLLRRPDVVSVAQNLGIEVVPVIGEGTIDEMVSLAKGRLLSTWGDFEAEGIVARPQVEMRDRSGRRIITKIKCADFANTA